MASYFQQLSDDMEKVAQVFTEGAKFMMGESSSMGGDGGEDIVSSDTTTMHGDDTHISDEDVGDGGIDMDGLDGAEDFGSPLMGMADSVMSGIMSNQVGPQTTKEHIQAFTSAITWNEPFIQSLLAFHIIIIITAITISRKGGIYTRMGFMICIGLIVRLAEYLNTTGNARWQEFGITQNYFDRGGIFMGIMVCAPLLMVCLCMLIHMIREASNLLKDVTQMKHTAKSRQKAKKDEEKKKKDEKKNSTVGPRRSQRTNKKKD